MKAANISTKIVIVMSSLMGLFCSFLFFAFLQIKSPVGDDIFGHLVVNEEVGIGAQKAYSVIACIMTAVSVSWSLFFIGLGLRLLKEKQNWMVNLMFIALVVWYALDTYASYYFGAILNVLLNTVFFMSTFVPLLVIKRSIKQVTLAVQ